MVPWGFFHVFHLSVYSFVSQLFLVNLPESRKKHSDRKLFFEIPESNSVFCDVKTAVVSGVLFWVVWTDGAGLFWQEAMKPINKATIILRMVLNFKMWIIFYGPEVAPPTYGRINGLNDSCKFAEVGNFPIDGSATCTKCNVNSPAGVWVVFALPAPCIGNPATLCCAPPGIQHILLLWRTIYTG